MRMLCRITFAKNDKRLNVKNGQIGTIEKIDFNGDCIVKIGEKQVQFNLKNQGKSPYPYIDHAYAITSYAVDARLTLISNSVETLDLETVFLRLIDQKEVAA